MIGCISTVDDVERLIPAWRDLLCRAPAATPFQTPEWLIEWWSAFVAGVLHVVIERRGDLVAVAPFYVRPDARQNSGTMVLIGTGNSDSLDLISEDGHDARTMVASCLEGAEQHGWECEWHRVPEDSPLLDQDARASGVDRIADDVPCPGVRLPDTDTQLDAQLDGRFRRSLRYGYRRAEQLGTVRFELARADRVQDALNDLFRLHADRWEQRAMKGVLADAAVQRFLRRAAARLDRVGALRLIRMRIGGEVAAVHLGMQMNGRAYYYIGGFNPRFKAISPGSQIVREAIRCAIGDGATWFDFLAGQEPYKYQWGAVDRRFFSRFVSKPAADNACATVSSATRHR